MLKNFSKTLLLLLLFAAFKVNNGYSQTFNYAEALQKSIFFYECQQSGTMPSWNRVNWKGNSGLKDGSDVGKDLTGGWYDAGDNVKFGFPMAYSATLLGWGAIDFKDGYTKSGQLTAIKNNLRFVYDYFIKCHTAPNEFYGQVGNGGSDHAFWGAAEVMQMARPSYKIDATHPGTDLAMETASALAVGSIIFAAEDPAYSATLLRHAKELYNFGNTYRGVYSTAIPDASGYYNSWSGYNDELVWGSIWLYRATNDITYLNKAEQDYLLIGNELGTTVKPYKWGLAWDDKTYACYPLLAKLTGNTKYMEDAERHLDYWTDGYNGAKLTYTPGGLAWLMQWGSLRHAANTAFVAFYYSDLATTSAAKKTKYKNFGLAQINYILGNNPSKRSYVCGFGNNPPINPHHRTAHGGWANNLIGPPTNNRHTIYGALVGGPGADDGYTDDRGNYVNNEVATDYNAAFSGALARIVMDGAASTPPAIPKETVGEEYFSTIKTNSTGTNYFEPAVKVYNHTAWPARIPSKLSFKYFIDITEGVAKGYTISNYTITLGYAPGASVSGFVKWSGNIYYVEVTYTNVLIYPGGQGESMKECQLRIVGPSDAWDPTNDFSNVGVTNTDNQTLNVPMYDNGVLVYGKEPGTSTSVNYTISATAGTGGTISPTGAVIVTSGTNKTFTITPSVGFDVNQVLVNGVSVGAVTTYTFSNVTGNQTIAASFKPIVVVADSINIVASAGAGGTISPNGTVRIPSGGSRTFTITANSGFAIANVLVNGASVGAVSTYTISGATTNQTIAASFRALGVDSFNIVASAGTGGSISPNGTVRIPSGGNRTFTITPTSGFAVAAVLVNGTSVGAVTSYSFSNVTANQTIAASFRAIVANDSINIVASAGTGGSISPAGTIRIPSGGSRTFVITAASGYSISNVLVNGTSVGAVATYTIAGATTNQTIVASFTPIITGNACLLTRFAVPRATPLPTLANASFSKVYTLGTGGPSLANVTNAVINWDLANKGLWQLSFNTNNGIPSWWIDMRSNVQNFASAQPAITFAGTGIANLDGNKYYVNVDGANVVFVEVTGKHAFYFSSSATAPVGCATAVTTAVASTTTATLFPNPITKGSNVTVKVPENYINKSVKVQITNLNGNVIKTYSTIVSGDKLMINTNGLNTGKCVISISSSVEKPATYALTIL